jgi:hypothetical protein
MTKVLLQLTNAMSCLLSRLVGGTRRGNLAKDGLHDVIINININIVQINIVQINIVQINIVSVHHKKLYPFDEL